jgi:hypothetical protein
VIRKLLPRSLDIEGLWPLCAVVAWLFVVGFFLQLGTMGSGFHLLIAVAILGVFAVPFACFAGLGLAWAIVVVVGFFQTFEP